MDASFQPQIDLLHHVLAHRQDIVGRLQELLNAQRKPLDYLRDGARLSRQVEDCFFADRELTPAQVRLRGRLDDARRASGFRPRPLPGLYNDLVEPSEMMMRAFHLWRETRWPGRNGRVRFAHTLFNLYVLRSLELLALRLWDEEPGRAGERLAQMQAALALLWRGSPPEQPVLVRDARWLIPLAQSPAADDLGAYFEVARHVADTLAAADRIEVHRAGVCMAGGHLRSQIRYYSLKAGETRDEHRLILAARHANALDFALLVQDLVPLLAAYEQAWRGGDDRTRQQLADAICQGLSPDPELFVNHLDLLGAYTMIEHLFIATDAAGRVVLTPTGERHVGLLREYADCLARVAAPLAEDCERFRPVAGTYSPYGVLYGFTTNLIEHMAFKTLQPDAVTGFSLEDVFATLDATGDTLAWVSGWRKLPHLSPEVEARFAYPQQFAEDAFGRVARALAARVAAEAREPARTGRLVVADAGRDPDERGAAPMPDVPVRYVRSSDRHLVAAGRAEPCDETELLRNRREGKYAVSYKTPAGWVAITKAVLTEVLGAGHDVRVAGLPRAAAQTLQLMCPGLVVLDGD